MDRRSKLEAPIKSEAKRGAEGSNLQSPGQAKFRIGDQVEVQDKRGVVRFDGVTEFAPGRENDGSVQGKRYFECRELHGMFVRPSQVKPIATAASTSSRISRAVNPRSGVASASSTVQERISRVAEIRARLNKLPAKPLVSEGLKDFSEGASSMTGPPAAEMDEPGNNEPATPEDKEDGLNFAPTALVGRADEMVPFRQFEELRIRMRVLEAKRAEDLAKWSKLEKVRNEVEQFRVLRKRMSEKLKVQLEESVTYRQCIKELRKEKDQLEEKLAENEIQIEALTLDREIAEEKVDYLQHQLDTLKERMDEAAFMAERAPNPDAIAHKIELGYDAKAAKEILDLQAQNERLKAALLRYREVATQNENQLRNQLRQAEEEAATLKQFKADYHAAKAKLAQAEEDAELLKARLEDFSSAEDMIETLTQQNLNLHDKVDQMAKDIEELEALKEVNDELEETHMENNRQLLLEMDHKDVQIRDLQRKVDAQQEAIADNINTLGQYRQLVGSLQDDLKQLQQHTQLQRHEAETLQSQSQKMLSLNSALQSQVVKAQARAIDLELRKLDALQATEHLRCIEPYLPESFFKRENDAIRTLLQLKRLHFKACLLGRHLCDPFPIKSWVALIGAPAELMALDDIVVSNYEFRHHLTELASTVAALMAFLASCSVPKFLAASSLAHDLTLAERKFDAYLDEVRREDFLASRQLADVQGLVSSLAHLFATVADASVPATDSVRAVVSASELITIKLALAYRAVANPRELGLAPITGSGDKGAIAQDYLRPLGEAIRDYQKVRTAAKKMLEASEELDANGNLLNPSLHAKLSACRAQHDLMVRFANEVSTRVIARLKDQQSREEPVALIHLQDQVYQATQAALEANEVGCFDASRKFIAGLEAQVKELLEAMMGADGQVSAPPAAHPWVLRSHEFKREIVVNTATERKLVSLNKDIARLTEDLRVKDQTLAERELKIELLDSRMEALRKQLAEAEKVELQLAQAQRQESLYLEAIEKFQTEVQTLEIEAIELRQVLKETEAAPSNQELPSAVAPPAAGPMDTRVEAMAKRVAHLTDLNLRRKAAQISVDLQFDPVYPCPNGGHLATQGLNEALASATSQAAALNKEISTVLAMPQILPPTQLSSAHLPHLAQSSLMSTYALQAQRLESLWQDAQLKLLNASLPGSILPPIRMA
ncbi:hypothetical protein L0F63_006490 [Massospora cicadina]|nr:hypothetical protein L0F63_006490 [Massospora cicadina]